MAGQVMEIDWEAIPSEVSGSFPSWFPTHLLLWFLVTSPELPFFWGGSWIGGVLPFEGYGVQKIVKLKGLVDLVLDNGSGENETLWEIEIWKLDFEPVSWKFSLHAPILQGLGPPVHSLRRRKKTQDLPKSNTFQRSKELKEPSEGQIGSKGKRSEDFC